MARVLSVRSSVGRRRAFGVIILGTANHRNLCVYEDNAFVYSSRCSRTYSFMRLTSVRGALLESSSGNKPSHSNLHKSSRVVSPGVKGPCTPLVKARVA